MLCQLCNSEYLADITIASNNRFTFIVRCWENFVGTGFVDPPLELKSDTNITFIYCLECGRTQNNFPWDRNSFSFVFDLPEQLDDIFEI